MWQYIYHMESYSGGARILGEGGQELFFFNE